MSQLIVCQENVQRYYGDKPEMLEKYRKIVESGKCPFCAPNIENVLVGQTQYWNVVENPFPYKNACVHLLLLPKRHVVFLAQSNREEWSDMPLAIDLAICKRPALAHGGGLALREKQVGGVTLYHLHWHLIAPAFGDDGQIPVNFGIG